DSALRCGFIPIRIGARVLRTETAAVAGLAALQTLWGDFR
ncbi:MAG: 16S rRNA (uracil(1498)-N(3))-methyltransferase, partial [Gallionella sp.]|nr:16S rRNA (uracil(1498)-N(3))-methyltransferase [Gallionella sp.]